VERSGLGHSHELAARGDGQLFIAGALLKLFDRFDIGISGGVELVDGDFIAPKALFSGDELVAIFLGGHSKSLYMVVNNKQRLA